MDPSRFKSCFDQIDARLLRLSPRRDILLLRLLVAVVAVLGFALDALYGLPWLFWMSIPFYVFCLVLYLEGLLKSLFLMRKISAELLIVLVMTVTLLDGTPLSGAMVAWFIGFGLYVSFLIIRKNREKIEQLIQEGKKTARVIQGHNLREIPIDQVKKGDWVVVPKGSMIPVDGLIQEGASSIDESFVTGEPFPVFKKAGGTVTSGTLNLNAPLQIKALKGGDDSFVSVITQEIEASLDRKSEIQRRADTTVQVLLLSVTSYSILLLLVTGSLHLMATALAVLCPCAWALATPAAFAATIGRLAKRNILARGGEPLENLQAIKTLILDKTGTVTQAEPEVSEIIGYGMERKEILELAASVESQFDHPIARAIIGFAKHHQVFPVHTVDHVEDIPGRGVKARIAGRQILIGSAETLADQGIRLPQIHYSGRAIWVAVDSELQGVIVIRDLILSAMRNLADTLRSYGIEKVILATGDNEEQEARRVAEYIGADEYHCKTTPAEKAALVRKMQVQGKVAMVGDGVNDAPALAAANVGVAIGGHKNINLAITSSDIVIIGNDAKDLLDALDSSTKMAMIIDQNYTWAVAFNGFGLIMATFGFLNPVLAAFLHHISSMFVVVNASRLYFTDIEESRLGVVFKRMDDCSRRRKAPA